MAPGPLLTKGNGTLARKWRKIKKRCSSFSSGDILNATHLSRSKSTCDDEDEGIGNDNKVTLRDKITSWNTELRRRRSSQGDSISQWWHWQGSRDSTPVTGSRPVVRSSSLKDDLNHRSRQEEEEDDEVFVTADPIRRTNVKEVKSAMIVSAVNPYCTGVRTSKTRKKRSLSKRSSSDWGEVTQTSTPRKPTTPEWTPATTAATSELSTPSATTNASTPSPPISDSSSESHPGSNNSHVFGHDQDSGYDGYCPGDKSLTSIGSSSENNSVTSSNYEESLYGNVARTKKDYAVYGQLPGGRIRPQSVYEKQFDGPVQQCLEAEAKANAYRSQISQATVVNLVNNGSSRVFARSDHHQTPPPLPPRPSQTTREAPPPLPPIHQYTGVASPKRITTSASLPRNRRLRKMVLAMTPEEPPQKDDQRLSLHDQEVKVKAVDNEEEETKKIDAKNKVKIHFPENSD